MRIPLHPGTCVFCYGLHWRLACWPFSAVFQVWRPQPVLGSVWLLAIDSPIGLDWAGLSGVGSALRASRVWPARPPAAKRAAGAVVSLRYFCTHKDRLLACALLAPSLGKGELARLVNCIALSAQQHRTHAVKRMRGVEPKVANFGQGFVSAGLGLQSTEDFGRMGLLDEKRADLTLYGMVGRVGVRPGKAMAMDVLAGHKQLQPLFFCSNPHPGLAGFAAAEAGAQ